MSILGGISSQNQGTVIFHASQNEIISLYQNWYDESILIWHAIVSIEAAIFKIVDQSKSSKMIQSYWRLHFWIDLNTIVWWYKFQKNWTIFDELRFNHVWWKSWFWGQNSIFYQTRLWIKNELLSVVSQIYQH